jgi:hypothetical protein
MAFIQQAVLVDPSDEFKPYLPTLKIAIYDPAGNIIKNAEGPPGPQGEPGPPGADGGGGSTADIRGRVNADGTARGGSGFSVTHVATGHYVITFDTAFADPPAVLLTVADTAGGISVKHYQGYPTTTTEVHVNVYNADASANVDAAFDFQALEL